MKAQELNTEGESVVPLPLVNAGRKSARSLE